MSEHGQDLWVFGYGSLMWRPDFPYVEAFRARLAGWHRRFCVVSRHYRGTPRAPGLILGLDRGGTCEGIVFRVAAGNARAVLSYLRAREQISGVYREARVSVTVRGDEPFERTAIVFLAEPGHPSFQRRLGLAQQARVIAHASGATGSNLDYLVNTISELKRMAIREPELDRILSVIGPVRALRRTVLPGRPRPRTPGRIARVDLGPRVNLLGVKRFSHRVRLS
jgi:cation transport protein ChaC